MAKKRSLTPAVRRKNAMVSLTDGIKALSLNSGVRPRSPELCPWTEGCRSGANGTEGKACERGVACRRINRLQSLWEAGYHDLKHIKPHHAPLVEQLVQARMIIAYCDHILNTRGFFSADRYGNEVLSTAFALRNRERNAFIKLHSELLLTPKTVLEAGGELEPASFGAMLDEADVIEVDFNGEEAETAHESDQDGSADSGAPETVSG